MKKMAIYPTRPVSTNLDGMTSGQTDKNGILINYRVGVMKCNVCETSFYTIYLSAVFVHRCCCSAPTRMFVTNSTALMFEQ